jgi:hypothetical protein
LFAHYGCDGLASAQCDFRGDREYVRGAANAIGAKKFHGARRHFSTEMHASKELIVQIKMNNQKEWIL